MWCRCSRGNRGCSRTAMKHAFFVSYQGGRPPTGWPHTAESGEPDCWGPEAKPLTLEPAPPTHTVGALEGAPSPHMRVAREGMRAKDAACVVHAQWKAWSVRAAYLPRYWVPGDCNARKETQRQRNGQKSNGNTRGYNTHIQAGAQMLLPMHQIPHKSFRSRNKHRTSVLTKPKGCLPCNPHSA